MSSFILIVIIINFYYILETWIQWLSLWWAFDFSIYILRIFSTFTKESYRYSDWFMYFWLPPDYRLLNFLLYILSLEKDRIKKKYIISRMCSFHLNYNWKISMFITESYIKNHYRDTSLSKIHFTLRQFSDKFSISKQIISCSFRFIFISNLMLSLKKNKFFLYLGPSQLTIKWQIFTLNEK